MTVRCRRPLVMRCGAMGDMVLLLPLVRTLHARFGEPVDIVSSGGWTRPLLAGQPGVGELYLVKSRRRPYLISPDQWRLVADLRRRGVGPTWFLDPEGIGAALLRRAGIGRSWIVDAEDFPRRPGEHQLERWARVAAAVPEALVAAPPPAGEPAVSGAALIVQPAARVELAALLARHGLEGRRLLLVQAGNKRTMRRGDRQRRSNNKYWPEAHWAALLAAMGRRCPEHALVLMGVDSERALNEDILGALAALDPRVRERARNLAGELPIPRLLALLERAEAMAGVDTGPAHAAAALGVPQVVLFGTADPDYYRPWGAAAAPVACVKGAADAPLAALPPEAALEAWARLPLRAAPAGAGEGQPG